VSFIYDRINQVKFTAGVAAVNHDGLPVVFNLSTMHATQTLCGGDDGARSLQVTGTEAGIGFRRIDPEYYFYNMSGDMS